MESLRWTAPVAYRREGTLAPYILAGLLLLVAILVAVFRGDVITTILFAMLAVMLVVHARRPVPLVDIVASPLGIQVGERNYPHEQIVSFYVDYRPEFEVKEVSLHLKRKLAPLVKIQLGSQDPVQTHLFLIEFIPEEKHEFTLIHTLIRWLGL